jgi:hypothetical protein
MKARLGGVEVSMVIESNNRYVQIFPATAKLSFYVWFFCFVLVCFVFPFGVSVSVMVAIGGVFLS